MNSDDWSDVGLPDDQALEFYKLEEYELVDGITHATYRITWYQSPGGGSWSDAELADANDYDAEMQHALGFGPFDGHFGGRTENLTDTVRKVWNAVQGGRELLNKREARQGRK